MEEVFLFVLVLLFETGFLHVVLNGSNAELETFKILFRYCPFNLSLESKV